MAPGLMGAAGLVIFSPRIGGQLGPGRASTPPAPRRGCAVDRGGLARAGALVLAANLLSGLGGAAYWVVMTRVTGLDAAGAAAKVVSASMIPGSVLGYGFSLAVAREAAEAGHGAAWSIFLGSLPVAAVAAAAGWLLALLLGRWAWIGGLLAGLTVASLAATQLLLGLEQYEDMLAAVAAGNAAKLSTGLLLGLRGLGAGAFLAGFLAAPAAMLATSLLLAARRGAGLGPYDRGRLARLGFSNSLQALGGQLPAVLTVYAYALAGAGDREAGILYMGVMVSTVLAGLPGSLATAALPQSVKRGRSLIERPLRVGLTLLAPLAAAFAAAPREVFSAVSPGFATRSAAEALAVLAASAPPQAVLQAAVVELNMKGDSAAIAASAAARIAAIAALTPPLARLAGTPGAAAAYTASVAAAIAALAPATPWTPGLALKSTLPQAPAAVAGATLAPLPAAAAAVAAAAWATGRMVYPLRSAVKTALQAARETLRGSRAKKGGAEIGPLG